MQIIEIKYFLNYRYYDKLQKYTDKLQKYTDNPKNFILCSM